MKTESDMITRLRTMPAEILARLGTGQVAYVRPIRSEAVASVYPQVPALDPGHQLWSLHAADGTPILLADSRDVALATASEQDLLTVQVH